MLWDTLLCALWLRMGLMPAIGHVGFQCGHKDKATGTDVAQSGPRDSLRRVGGESASPNAPGSLRIAVGMKVLSNPGAQS
jgi:hypothetical protein